MNKFITKLAKIFLGLSMAAGVGVAIGAGRKDASPAHAAETKVSLTTGSNTVAIKVNYNSAGAPTSNNGARLSTSSKLGSVTFTIPSGTTTFGFYAVGWKGKTTTASLTASVGTLGSSSVSLTANDAATGTINAGATVAITGTDADCKKEISISSVTAASSITVTTSSSEKRMIIWDAYYVTADKTLSSISVQTAPTKTSYKEGDYFDPTGLVITRTYTDSTSDTYAYAGHTSDFTFSPSTSTALTTSNASVTITYGGKSTSQAINVAALKTPASVTSSGHTTTFDSGDTFAYGGTLTVTYTDSTSAGVSPTSFKIGASEIDPTSAGTVITPGSTELTNDDHNGKTVYVLYTENNTTVYTSYVITVNKVSSVTFTGGTDKGDVQNSITKSGITISVPTTSDGTFIRDDNFRVYAGKDVTIESTIGNISKIEFTFTSEGYNTLSGSGYTASGADGTWTGDASSVTLSASSQARITLIVVTLASTDPLVELTVDSATSVSMMKGDSDTSVKVHVANITSKTWTYTFDENEDEGLSTSSYINVSAGAAVDDVHTLTITTKAVGSTVLHIAVSGTACATSIPVTVAAKPASMMVTESDHETQITTLELQSGGATKQVYWIGEDTDENPYSIAAAQVNGEIISGSSYVSISSGAGTVITPVAAGTAVIRYSLKVLSSVYAEITVNVVDDYKTTVNSITFNSNLTDTQGDPVDSSAVFATKVANTHFGSTETIADSELLFSYENNRSGAEAIGIFSYDFAHGTTVDSTHKSQTVYVFTTFDESYSGSFTITVEQKNDPLTAITITNVTSNAKEIARGDSFQLEIAYTPANPTDGKEVTYRVDDSDAGVSVSVNASGLISVAASSGLGDALVVVESSHDATIYDYVYVTVVLESMTYIVSETETWSKASSITAGDSIIILNETASKELTGVTSNIGTATAYETNPNHTYSLTVEAGSSSGQFYLKDSDDKYLAYNKPSGTTKNNNLFLLSDKTADGTLWTVEISNGDATITNVYNNERSIQFNSDRFCCYSSSQTAVQIYKKSGGNTPYTVTEALFNAIHNNFGSGMTYEWSESCSSFDDGAWADACEVIVDLTDYDDYKLNRAVADANGNEIEVFLAKYDYLVLKFGTNDYDYLGRFQEGGINYGQRTGIIPLVNIIGENTNTVAIIVIISVVSMTAIGGYFFLRKRKENI